MLMRMAQIEEEKNGREREPKRKTLGKCSYTMAGTGQGQVLKLENSSSLLKIFYSYQVEHTCTREAEAGGSLPQCWN